MPVKTQVMWKREFSEYSRYGLKIVDIEPDVGKESENYIDSLKLRLKTTFYIE